MMSRIFEFQITGGTPESRNEAADSHAMNQGLDVVSKRDKGERLIVTLSNPEIEWAKEADERQDSDSKTDLA